MAAHRSLCLPHVRQTLAGSTKVLRRDEAAKKPLECALVASAVAFMGPKWRRPLMFYFSLIMAADREKLATDWSLSMHPASVSACMALPQAWEAWPPQTLVARQRWRPYRLARRRASVEQLATPHRAELERRVDEPRACLGRQLAPSGQARLVKHGAASPISRGLGGPPSRVICRRTAHRKSGENGEGGDGGAAEGCDSCPLPVWPRVNRGRTVGAWLASGLV